MPEQYDRIVKIIPLVKERKGRDGTPYSDNVGKLSVYASGKVLVIVPAIGAFWRAATENTWTPQQRGFQKVPQQKPIVPPQQAPFMPAPEQEAAFNPPDDGCPL